MAVLLYFAAKVKWPNRLSDEIEVSKSILTNLGSWKDSVVPDDANNHLPEAADPITRVQALNPHVRTLLVRFGADKRCGTQWKREFTISDCGTLTFWVMPRRPKKHLQIRRPFWGYLCMTTKVHCQFFSWYTPTLRAYQNEQDSQNTCSTSLSLGLRTLNL